MTHVTGIVTRNGAAVRVGAALLSLPSAKTPAGEWVAGVIAAIDSGAIKPCPNCGRYSCECWEWAELMTAPQPAPLDVMTADDIPL